MTQAKNEIEQLKSQEETLRYLATSLEEVLKKLHGPKTGFMLLTFQFNKIGTAQYISNAERSTMIEFLRETLVRLENNEDIRAGVGAVN